MALTRDQIKQLQQHLTELNYRCEVTGEITAETIRGYKVASRNIEVVPVDIYSLTEVPNLTPKVPATGNKQ